MKNLKRILYSVYAILILCVIISNFVDCSHKDSKPIPNPTPNPVIHDTIWKRDTIYVRDTINQGAVERADTIGNKGRLKVTLLWDFPADIDLHVLEPSGNIINYRNKKNEQSGGFLDVDNTNGGYGSAENIYWENPPKGEYQIAIEYYAAVNNMVYSGNCNVVIMRDGYEPSTYTVRMSQVKQSFLITTIQIN